MRCRQGIFTKLVSIKHFTQLIRLLVKAMCFILKIFILQMIGMVCHQLKRQVIVIQEARLAFWEETILPLLDHAIDSLNNWLLPKFDSNLELSYDHNAISALALRQEKNWRRIQKADFMTINEKRAAIGLPPLAGCEKIS